MADCPRCQATLFSPKACGSCGWRARGRVEPSSTQAPDPIPCAHEVCTSYAFVRIRTTTGWANLCVTHYEQHFARQGDAAHTAAGLDRMQDESREDWKKRVFAHWRELSKRAPINRRVFEAVQHNEPEKEIAWT